MIRIGISTLCALVLSAQTYDIVLSNGRVMDPESGLDAVRNVGIRGGKIAAVSAGALRGTTVVDVSGHVVAPGFIDLHSHGQDDENYRFQARDGVTTALELEIGVAEAAAWYRQREGRALVHFGASSGHVPARMAVMKDTGDFLPRDEAARRAATEEETLAILHTVRQGLDAGAIGVGFGIAYVPTAPREEILRVFRLAGERRVPVFVHLRGDGAIGALQEVIANAVITGAPLHVVHITSVCGKSAATCLEMIDGARKRGLDITTEMYPYTASATRIESALFDGDWEKRTGNRFSDLQWVATGERLTAESFARYRQQGGSVISHTVPEAALKAALASPSVMIASDGRLTNGKGHPRSSGTYARVLGRYVREERALTLMEALRKMTILPARRLEASVPAMKQKGRIRTGADADLTVFDPAKVIDRATFEDAAQPSAGIPHVLVNGVFVVRDGKLVEGVFPGTAMKTR